MTGSPSFHANMLIADTLSADNRLTGLLIRRIG